MEIVFKNPIMFFMFLLFPLLIFLHNYFFEHTKRRAMKFANYAAMRRVTGTHLITKNTHHLVIRLVTLTFLILASASPEIRYMGKASINDYVIAIDTSASMLSDDVPPFRLDVAKKIANFFIDKLKDETNIGLVSFSGVSFVRAQMTNDKGKIKNALSQLDIELSGGTDIGAALITSTNLLLPSEKSKAIVLISDGSDTAGILLDESIRTALEYLREKQVSVHAVAIGSGAGKAGYVGETELKPVYDSTILKEIADQTNGRFYEVRTLGEMYAAFNDFENQTEKGKISFVLGNILMALGFLLLLVEWGLMNTFFRPIP